MLSFLGVTASWVWERDQPMALFSTHQPVTAGVPGGWVCSRIPGQEGPFAHTAVTPACPLITRS